MGCLYYSQLKGNMWGKVGCIGPLGKYDCFKETYLLTLLVARFSHLSFAVHFRKAKKKIMLKEK
jgi:hypothetical protein